MIDWKRESEKFASAVSKEEKRHHLSHKLRRRNNFYHHSVGTPVLKLKKQIMQILEDSVEQDYHWDGEEEYPFDSLNKDSAANKIIHLLSTKGLLKKLK